MSHLSEFIESLLTEVQDINLDEPIAAQGITDIVSPSENPDVPTDISDIDINSDVLTIDKLKQAAMVSPKSKFKGCPDTVWEFVNKYWNKLGLDSLSAEEALKILEKRITYGDISNFKSSSESEAKAKERLQNKTDNCEVKGDLVVMLGD